MNLAIPAIRDAGTFQAERLVFRVTASTDIGEFMAFRAEAEDGTVTTNITHMFWFPDKPVRTGDVVVLYTKKGLEKHRLNKNGSTSHFYYWGSSQILWDSPKFVAVIAHIDEWNSTLASDEARDDGRESAAAGVARHV